MTDVILYKRVAAGRDINDPNLFADITTSTFTYTNNGGEITLHFTPDITEDEARLVTWRATLTPEEEAVLRNLRASLPDLRTIRDSSGTLTAAQLSNAVRVLAGSQISSVRLAIRDLTGTT